MTPLFSKNFKILTNFLEKEEISPKVAIWTAIFHFLISKNLLNDETSEYFRECWDVKPHEELLKLLEPFIENDLKGDFLGNLYLSIQHKSKKKEKGQFFTPLEDVFKAINHDLNFLKERKNLKILDPACGSGRLLSTILKNVKPENANITVYDIDDVCLMICKANLFIVHGIKIRSLKKNFLEEVPSEQFDYVIANPPWGCPSPSKKYADIFSDFIEHSFSFLKKDGLCRFFLPISITNVKTHDNIRKWIDSPERNLSEIFFFEKPFPNLITKYVSLKIEKKERENYLSVHRDGESFQSDKSFFNHFQTSSFIVCNKNEKEILSKMIERGKYHIAKENYALGIVTGNNKKFLSSIKENDMVPIISGKEIEKYKISSAKHFIAFDKVRSQLQQVAPLDFYFCPEKLIYRYVSPKLVVAYDDKQHLCLNTANIIIPKGIPYSFKVICALLNSELYNFWRRKISNQLKMMTEDLSNIPFPEISLFHQRLLEKHFNSENSEAIDDLILDIFDIEKDDFLETCSSVPQCG